MEPALKELFNYGALGIVLATVLGLFLWAFKRMIDNTFEQQKLTIVQQEKFNVFLVKLTEALDGIRSNCLTCRQDSLSTIRDESASTAKQVADVVWDSHGKLVAIIGESARTFDRSIERSFDQLGVELENRDLRERTQPYATPVPGVVR